MQTSTEQFDQLITRAMDELPQEYITNMNNVAIVLEEEPDEQQKHKLGVRQGSLLLGLFEGVPRPLQTGNEIAAIPSKITLFKRPIEIVSHDSSALFEQIKRTLWHEIAHYYGLDHDRIHHLESKK